MKRVVSILGICVAVAWFPNVALAADRDSVCDALKDQTSGLYGLCIAYCESGHGTSATLDAYNRLKGAGDPAMPCSGPLNIQIHVKNPYTGNPIEDGATVPPHAPYQVSVETNGVDCAGAFVLTALGAPGNPPSVIVSTVPFVIGPYTGDNTATGNIRTAGVNPDGTNAFKVSASCNGADPSQFAFDQSEFFVQ